jgi:predicted alpha/beta-fold hydrolase
MTEIAFRRRSGAPVPSRIFAAVRNVAPGIRLRLFTYGLEGSETDLSEAYARQIFEAAATPRTWEVVAQMERAAEMRG